MVDITGRDDVDFERMFDVTRKFVQKGIDIYPTIHPNVSPPDKLYGFFIRLLEIHAHLPLRFALIDVDLRYDAAQRRMVECHRGGRKPRLHSKDLGLYEWGRLIRETYGFGYGAIPRHLVSLGKPAKQGGGWKKGIPSAPSYDKFEYRRSRVYLWKSTKRPKYIQDLLTVLALPHDFAFTIAYDEAWVQQDLCKYAKIWRDKLESTDVVVGYANESDGKEVIVPFRMASLRKVSHAGSVVAFSYVANRYLGGPQGEERAEKWRAEVHEELQEMFGRNTLPPVGRTYAALGAKVVRIEGRGPGEDVDWQSVVAYLSQLPELKQCLFFRVEMDEDVRAKLRTRDNGTLMSTWIQLSPGESANLTLRYYMPNIISVQEACDARPVVRVVSSDETVLSILSPEEIEVDKYGTFDIDLVAGRVGADADAVLSIYHSQRPEYGPFVRVPVRVVPQRAKRAAQEALSNVLGGAAMGLVGFAVMVLGSQTATHKGLEEAIKQWPAYLWPIVWVVGGGAFLVVSLSWLSAYLRRLSS